MPWQPLPRIAFAVATFPFAASGPADLPLEIGDELYIIEETPDGSWLRGYLVSPPSLLAGLTSEKGQTLEARVFSGIFPRSCVEVREVLGESDDNGELDEDGKEEAEIQVVHSEGTNGNSSPAEGKRMKDKTKGLEISILSLSGGLDKFDRGSSRTPPHASETTTTAPGRLSIPIKRDPNAPRPPAPVPMLKIGDETPTSASEPLIDEIASCLREWHSTNLHALLLARQYSKLDKLWQLVCGLNFCRQQLLHNVLTTWEYNKLRERTVWDLVRVNKLCGGEVIVRDPQERGRILTGDDSVVEITKLQSIMSLLDERPQQPVEITALHHLLVDIRGFAGAANSPTTLVIYLASKPVGGVLRALSESYIVEVPAGGTMGHLARQSQMKTLFAGLSSADVGDTPSAETELFLVVKMRAPQQLLVGKTASRSNSSAQDTAYSGEHRKPPLSVGNRSVRRSLMWGAKSTRSALSRGSPKLGSLDENGDEKIQDTPGSRDGRPSTATSKASRGSLDISQQASQLTAERTVGVGILKLNAIMKQPGDVEQVVSMWSPSTRLVDRQGSEEWDPAIREVLDSSTGQYEKSRMAERLQFHLRAFNDPDADGLIKATPTILSGVSKTNKMGFSGAPTKARSDIYVTIDEAFVSRQTLLSRFGGSATSLPGNMNGSNLQVTFEVRRPNGERISNCIHASSSSEAISTWRSTATERGEPWKQTLRLALAPQDVTSAHLVMFLADLPNPPFAVSYIPLWDQQAFMRDGLHSLLLYKVDEFTVTPQAGQSGRGGYLSLPWAAKGQSEHQHEVTGPLAILRLETYLCSTRFSQDRVILGLLRWKECPKEEIPNLLRELIFVAEIEVVKLLSDVLDALFGILVEYSGNDEYEDLVFTALIRVLSIVHDRRFNLGPIVDQYAETKFNYPFATPCLVRSFTRLLSKPTEPETARKLRATFKVVRHILKFIAHAREQLKAKEADIGITGSAASFSRNIRAIFKALDAMMRNAAPVLVGSQTLAVQHFHTWLPELTGILTTEEILHIAIDFIDSCASVKGKLVLYKLVLIINYAKLDIFSQPEQRSALCASTVRWIAPHWGQTDEINEQYRDQVRLCCSVLASQVNSLGPEIPDHIPKIMDSYLALFAVPPKPRSRLSLLFPTAYPFPNRPTTEELHLDEGLIELSAILSALSNSSSGMQLELAEDDMRVIIDSTLRVHISILQGEAFPSSWLSVHIYHHKSTMRTLQYLAGILLESYLPHPDEAENFDTELWKLFFCTLLKLVGSPSLALETFPEQKRRAVWKIAGDVREHGADLLRRTWEAIGWETSADERARYGLSKMGGYQVQYVPTLVGPIVELCLSVHQGLRTMAVEVLQTMIVSEWTLSEDLSVIQTEMIDCLDQYFKTKPLTESILQKLFVAELLQRFEALAKVPDEPLYVALRELMATVDEFLDLLVAVHSGDGVSEASNLIHRLRLMEFLRDMQKEEIFVRYVHQLADLQAEARNHAQAGLALRLHAELYDWDPIKQTGALLDPDFPPQSHFERKERIYFDMIKHYEDGEAWSSALDAYKELQAQYETNIFDFAKLARTQRAIASIYETIVRSDHSVVPKYFKVVYKGLGFPTSLRDKEFVFEGSPTERASAFTDRMQELYPAAQIVASEDIDDVEGQFLVISSLSPHRDLDHHAFQRARVGQVVRDYLLAAHPRAFSVSSKRVTSGPVTDHYAEKIVYTTAESFPTILRRSEIVDMQEIRLDAKETALERIVRKTQEMTTVERKVLDGEGGDDVVQLLLDAVSISVNPASENSVVTYRKLLPGTYGGATPGGDRKPAGSGSNDSAADGLEDDAEDAEVPELDAQENAIRMALVDHAIMIKRCLGTFAKSGNEVLRRKQEDLQKHFEATFAPEIAFFTPPQAVRDAASATINSNSPTWPRSPPSTKDTSTPTPRLAQAANLPSASEGGEEVSIVRPISFRQGRGARLSFLGGRKKDASVATPQSPAVEQAASPALNGTGRNNSISGQTNGDAASETSRGRSSSGRDREGAQPTRRSFFHSRSSDSNARIASPATGTPPVPPLNGAFASQQQQQQQQQHFSSYGPGSAGGGSDWMTVSGGRDGGGGTTYNTHVTGSTGTGLSVDAMKENQRLQQGSGMSADALKAGGSVRKRLSLLKLGRKTSRGNGLLVGVDEE